MHIVRKCNNLRSVDLVLVVGDINKYRYFLQKCVYLTTLLQLPTLLTRMAR
jgi:hypothetical protein